MRTGTIFKRYELFVAAATIAAHANAREDGFRQKDVRFLIELSSNWLGSTFEGEMLAVSNTQVQRYLEHLVVEGFARRVTRKGHPCYRLTRVGLIELTNRLIPRTVYVQPEHFFFLYYFLENYRPRVEKLIAREGKQFPYAMALEVEGLFDSKNLLEQQIQFVEIELKKLAVRIQDAIDGGKQAAEMLAQGVPVQKVAKEIEKHYPYKLNSQKPLSELISEVPDEIAAWELAIGSERRALQIWAPTKTMLECYLDCLRKLLAEKTREETRSG